MKRIGITGQTGFAGSYLYDKISLLKDEFELVDFDKSFFDSEGLMCKWVKQCDVVVHFAALNRHLDAQIIHDKNVELVNKLISAFINTEHAPHVLFSSSTQEERDNLYGRSKKQGRELFAAWANETGACFTGMIIPNIFGPFGKPFYNSAIATFCHQLVNGLDPMIDNDGFLKLIYIDELAEIFLHAIREGKSDSALTVKPTSGMYVSQILERLIRFKDLYFEKGVIPELKDTFSINLFNTFRSYIDHAKYFPFKLEQNTDSRGLFVEMIKLHQGGQVSFSTTVAGITRGNHFHTRKIERFIVIKGKALIQMRKYNSNQTFNFHLDGDNPSYVDMPIWHTHNIKNIGEEDLYTIFWINEFYDPADSDTYFETV
jgi:UDP-2-acetamido-2,6-beta-L-arabino-hexul-4-ose reductase